MNFSGKILVFILGFVLFVVPVFAGGNITVTGTDKAPTYTNTKNVTNMLSLALDVSPDEGDGTVNITSINITIGGNATPTYLTAVHIKNSTGSSIASNTTNVTSTKFRISIPNGLFVNSSTNDTAFIALNLSASAYAVDNVSASIAAVSDIETAGAGDNITIATAASTESKIQDVHATASISPSYVDTNILNQSFSYTVEPTGNDRFSNVSITVPIGYVVVNVTSVKHGSTMLRNSSTQHENLTVTFSDNLISINFTHGYTNSVIINFTVNTNNSEVAQLAFNSTIGNINLTTVATDFAATNTSVTTQVLLNVTAVNAIKSTAYLNGSDYWEFNFAVNFSAAVTGLLQFKMNNWTDSAGKSIAIRSGSTYRATLRDAAQSSNTMDVDQNYNISNTLSFTVTQGEVKNLRLRMIIPASTEVSTSWWTTYTMLFRSTP